MRAYLTRELRGVNGDTRETNGRTFLVNVFPTQRDAFMLCEKREPDQIVCFPLEVLRNAPS